MTMINELNYLKNLFGEIDRSPLQQNGFYESDCEILALGDSFLALTIDSIVEEVSLGIYRDPYTIGYMSAVSSISDLIAVGAKPLGLLNTIEVPAGFKDSERVIAGVNDACRKNQTYLLGGDTNLSDRFSIGVAGIGIVKDSKPVSRIGAKPEHKVFFSGLAGMGNANALNELLLGGAFPKVLIHPDLGRLHHVISSYASAAIDTSDGMISALAVLGEMNEVNFELSSQPDTLLDQQSMTIINEAGLPPWYLLAGPVGEYGILFSVRPDLEEELCSEICSQELKVIEIGQVVDGYFNSSTAKIEGTKLPVGEINNRLQQCAGDISEIIKSLEDYEIEWSN